MAANTKTLSSLLDSFSRLKGQGRVQYCVFELDYSLSLVVSVKPVCCVLDFTVKVSLLDRNHSWLHSLCQPGSGHCMGGIQNK